MNATTPRHGKLSTGLRALIKKLANYQAANSGGVKEHRVKHTIIATDTCHICGATGDQECDAGLHG